MSTDTASSGSHGDAGRSSSLPACRHVQVQLGDPAIVKHTLDEQAAVFFLDHGYTEDTTLSNIRIGLSVVSILLTVLAQFYPLPYPANASFLKVCVVVYFILQAALQALHLLVETDAILVTNARTEQTGNEKSDGKKKKGGHHQKKKKKSSSSSAASDADGSLVLPAYPISLQASSPRYDTTYKVTLSTRPSSSLLLTLLAVFRRARTEAPAAVPAISVSAELQVTDFFDVNGVLLMERLEDRLSELMEQFADQAAALQGKKSE